MRGGLCRAAFQNPLEHIPLPPHHSRMGYRTTAFTRSLDTFDPTFAPYISPYPVDYPEEFLGQPPEFLEFPPVRYNDYRMFVDGPKTRPISELGLDVDFTMHRPLLLPIDDELYGPRHFPNFTLMPETAYEHSNAELPQ